MGNPLGRRGWRLEVALCSHVGANRDSFEEVFMEGVERNHAADTFLSGLVEVWFLTRFLGLELLAPECVRMRLAQLGFTGRS